MSTPDVRQAPLPCPFCGHDGPLDFSEGSTFRWLSYSCGGCGVGNETRVQTLGDGTPEQWRAKAEQDAISEWNERKPARAALSEPPKAGAPEGWQPIETAPTNETALLYAPPEQLFERPEGKRGQWFVAAPRNWTWARYWMPLPAAPKPEDTK